MASPVTAFADQNSAAVSETETQDKSVDEVQKTEQGDINPVSDASAQNEIKTETQSSSQGPVEEQAEAALSDAGKQFTQDVAALNWDDIQQTRQAKFEADSALFHHSEDADAKSTAENADSNMKQVQDKLTALQKTYQSLSDTDRADESVQKAEETLKSITEKLSTYEKEYFEKKVEDFQKAVNEAGPDEDQDQKTRQADLDSLKEVYKEFSDGQKNDEDVKAAYKILKGFLGDETVASTQSTENTSDDQKSGEATAEEKPRVAAAKKAPAAENNPTVSNESAVITGSITWADDLAKNVLFDAVNDTDFYQFQVTVTK